MGTLDTLHPVTQFLLPLAAEPAFAALWVAALGALGECTKPRSEELAEAVPEALKNMLLVMAAQGVLTPAWTVRSLLRYVEVMHDSVMPALCLLWRF